MMKHDTEEEEITLRDGTVIYRAVYDRVLDLLRTGRTFTIDGETLTVEPPIDFDGIEWLNIHVTEIAAMLREVTP